MLFISIEKFFSFSRYLNSYLDVLSMYKKQFDQKHQVNFKIYDKQIQQTFCTLFHEVNATRQWNLFSYQYIKRKIFFFKNYAKNEAEKLVPDLFLVFQKAFCEG